MMTRTRNNVANIPSPWFGEEKCTKVNPYTNACKTYTGFKFNGITAHVGDYVLILGDEADKLAFEGCDVGRIEHLFELTCHGDKYRAHVQWYSKPSKIPATIDTDHMDERYEIVEDGRNFDSNVSIETICKNCTVVLLYEDEIPEEVYRNNKDDFQPLFVCRYRLYQKGSELYVEPVLKLDGTIGLAESNSVSGINEVDKRFMKFMPNEIIAKPSTRSLKMKLKQKTSEISKESRIVTRRSQTFALEIETQNNITAKLRSALRKCSIDCDSDSSTTSSQAKRAARININSDLENSSKLTPTKNTSKSKKKSEVTPSKRSCRLKSLTSESDHSSVNMDQSSITAITRNSRMPNDTNEVDKPTPTKIRTPGSGRKRRAIRSSSEDSFEPRSRSISPEIDCAGPPSAYQLYETKGQTYIIKKPIDIVKKAARKLNDSNISSLLSSSDSEPFDKLQKTGVKLVARSRANNTGFELLSTPQKDGRSLENIIEHNQSETPKSGRRNLSETLNTKDTPGAQRDLLLKKLADKREDVSLRIKLRRSSEQSNYKIDSDSDTGVNNKYRRRTILDTPKSILKVNSKKPNTPSVRFKEQNELEKYSPTNELAEKFRKVEIKLKRIDTKVVRKSSRDVKTNPKYSDYETVDLPINLNGTPTKRLGKIINYNYDRDNDNPMSVKNKEDRRIRQTRSVANYCQSSDNESTTMSDSDSNNLQTRDSDTEIIESNEENYPNRTPRRIRYSKNNSTKDGMLNRKLDSNQRILVEQQKTPNQISEMNDDHYDLERSQTPRKGKSNRVTDVKSNLSRIGAKSNSEDIEPTTPKRSVLTPKLQTPSRSVRNRLLTPSMQQRNKSVIKPATPLQEARARLHVSAVPKSLPCREEEFNNIYTFLEGKLMDNSGGCLYISGVPGTGKTATVNEVIRCLKRSVSKGKFSDFEFIQINGMKLTEPRQAYVEILKQSTGKKATWEQAHELLDKIFTKTSSKKPMTLLLVDELDILCNKRQDVVYNLLDWPAKSSAHLVVITIANTMDLPERVLMGRVTSRLGLTRLTFQPYTHKQLQEIVTARLNDSHAFKSEAIQLVARKVAAVSGDARRALDICRRATEVAEVNNSEIVSMQDVNEALTEMIASAKVQAIRHCSEMERMFLQAVCAEVGRTGVEEVTFNNIYIQLLTLCSLEGLQVPSVTDAIMICARLGASRLLICEHSRTDIHQRVLLNVSSDDVHFSLQRIEV